MAVHKYRVKKGDNYTVVLNRVIGLLKGNLPALGLYTYLLSLPASWEFHKKELRKTCNVGMDKLDDLLTLLRKHGLIEIIPIRNSRGQFVFFDLEVLDGTSTGVKTTPVETTGVVNSTYKRNIVKKKKEEIKEKAFKAKAVDNSEKIKKAKQGNKKRHDWADMKNEKAAIERHEKQKKLECSTENTRFVRSLLHPHALTGDKNEIDW